MSIYATPGTLPPDPAPLPGTGRSESRSARARAVPAAAAIAERRVGAIVIVLLDLLRDVPRLVAPYDPIFDNNFAD